MDPIETFLLNPKYHDVLAIVKGFRNGLVYGAKIRAPHAAVMVFLFKGGTLQQKMMAIFLATRQHAKNLAIYVTIYKTAMYVLKQLNHGKSRSLDPFVSGLLGGYIVFGSNNNINQQIVLYVFSRVVMASFKVVANSLLDESSASAQVITPRARASTWPLFASLCWASVMYLHESHPHTLQISLANSMTYLYKRSETWDGLKTFVWHNT